jgi:hypothetical protein
MIQTTRVVLESIIESDQFNQLSVQHEPSGYGMSDLSRE